MIHCIWATKERWLPGDVVASLHPGVGRIKWGLRFGLKKSHPKSQQNPTVDGQKLLNVVLFPGYYSSQFDAGFFIQQYHHSRIKSEGFEFMVSPPKTFLESSTHSQYYQLEDWLAVHTSTKIPMVFIICRISNHKLTPKKSTKNRPTHIRFNFPQPSNAAWPHAFPPCLQSAKHLPPATCWWSWTLTWGPNMDGHKDCE